ncbi:MAG: restriction endonuclease [Desulfotalea sp.]|nr:MAG: restriction endonuclease [Desulfotalea sp.]
MVRAGYKQTAVGVIPKEWKVSQLCDLAEIRSGVAKNSNVSVNNPILVYYLRVANVQDGFLELSEMSKIKISRNDLKRYTVLPGDVLMNEGGDLDKLGRGSIWHGQFNPCIHQNHVFVIRCGSQLLPQYLNIWSSTITANRYFMVAGKQTTNLASINKTSLGKLPVATPSLTEQQAIAEALSDMDGLLDGLTKLIAKKRHIKTATMQQLLTGKTRLPGFGEGKGYKQTELGDIPEDWEVVELGELLTIKHGRDQKEIVVVDGCYPILATGGEIGRTNTPLYSKPSVLIGRKGTIDKPLYMDKPFWTVDTLFYSEVNKTSSPKFLYYKFNLIDWYSYNEASGVPSLNAKSIEKIAIAQPVSLAEQQSIVKVLSDMDKELESLETRLHKTKAIKQGMMQELLTGKTRLI